MNPLAAASLRMPQLALSAAGKGCRRWTCTGWNRLPQASQPRWT